MYHNVEPFGEQRADLRTAILICYLLNHLTERKTPLQVKDIWPFFGESQGAEPVRSGIQRGIDLEKKMRVFTQLHNWNVDAAQTRGAGTDTPREYRPAPGGRLS